MNKYILFWLLILKSGIMFSQLPCKLYPSDTIKVFNGGCMSIWGNFYNTANSASGGSLVINLGGKVTMYGDTFKSINATKIGGTGNFEMVRPRPSPYSASGKQVLLTGGSNVSFSSFSVNTASIVELQNEDMGIRDSLKFISGHIVLNTNNLVVGEGNPGVITGYDENSFIVSNGNTLDTNKGFLIREQVGSANTVFPVGHATGDYTPVMISNSGTADNFKVRAFDTVYEEGYLINSNPLTANERSVQRTWDLREGTSGGSNVNLTLQYNTSTEASLFNSRRGKSFISHYTGVYPNNGGDTLSNWKWDMFKLSSTSAPTSPGTITTGSNIAGAAMKTRNGITSFSPFSITTWTSQAIPLPVHILSFNAEWVNTTDAELRWTIADVDLLKSIQLERSFDGNNFSLIKTFNNLNMITSYRYFDIGVYNLVNSKVFYRLKLTEHNGNTISSDKKLLLKNSANATSINISPNPASTSFNIDFKMVDTSTPISIKIYNPLGKLVYENTLNERQSNSFSEMISIANFPSGIYQLSVLGNNISLNEKLIINH